MGFFDRFRKKSQQVVNKTPAVDRISVEDLLDQNYTCQEIAEQLSIDLQTVYNIKQAKKRREQTMTRQAGSDPEDPLEAKKKELEILKMEKEIEKVQAEIDDMKDYDDYDDEPDREDPNAWITQLVGAFMSQRGMPMPQPQRVLPPNMPGQPDQSQLQNFGMPQNVVPARPSLSDEQLREIKKNIPGKFLKQAQKMTPDTLKSLAKSYLPGYEEETYDRALLVLQEK